MTENTDNIITPAANEVEMDASASRPNSKKRRKEKRKRCRK